MQMYLGKMKSTVVVSTTRKHQRTVLLTAAVSGVLAVVLGTFGAHLFKDRITPQEYLNYEKAVQYHYYYTLFVFGIGVLMGQLLDSKFFFSSVVWFVLGIIFFSGSLYFINTKSVLGVDIPPFVYIITPIGGMCFIMGWIWLIVSVITKKPINV